MFKPIAVSLVFAAACGPLPGERATAGCPVGEVCSDETPNGLFFEGQRLSDRIFDRGDHPTAVGGEQTIEVFASERRNPLNAPFLAEIDGDAEVVAVGPSFVTVRPSAEGPFVLRMLDNDGALMDRITLASAEADRANLEPTASHILGDVEGMLELEPLYLEARDVPLVIALNDSALNDSESIRLVDETATAPGTATDLWDVYEVTAMPGALEISSADESYLATLETTDSIDAIVNLGNSIVIAPDSAEHRCFRAARDERAVLGVNWSFELSAPGGSLQSSVAPNCVSIEVGQESGTLRVTAEQLTLSIEVVVASSLVSTASPSGDGAGRYVPSPLAGERAASFQL